MMHQNERMTEGSGDGLRVLILKKVFLNKTETFILNEIRRLKEKDGPEVLVASNKEVARRFHLGHEPEILPVNRLTNYLYHRFNKEPYPISYRNAGLKRSLNGVIKQFQPDVIHCHYGTDACMYLNHLGDATGIPVVISFHGYDGSKALRYTPYVDALRKWLKQEHVYCVFPSEFMLNTVREQGVELAHSRVVYYGTNVSQFERKGGGSDRGEKRFLQVSSFREKKGHKYTLQAFRMFLDDKKDSGQKYKLVLAGNGTTFDEIKSLASELDLEGHVEFPGFVSPDKARELMNSCHYFVHHSVTGENGDSEGIPNAIMEAMAMEMPVLSSRHAGIPELVQDGVNGILVDERDVEAYAGAFGQICGWNYLPENRRRVEEMFATEPHFRSLTGFYRAAVENRGGSQSPQNN